MSSAADRRNSPKSQPSWLRSILGPLFNRKRHRLEQSCRRIVEAYHPRMAAALQSLDTAQGRGIEYYWKLHDLILLLEQHQPRTVVELGSGRTSCVFAAYATRHGANYIAFEQDARWVKSVSDALDHITNVAAIRLVGVESADRGGAFVEPIAAGTECVYVDAPHVPKTRRFPTFTGKPAYLDVPRHLEAGHRPKLVIVDGRTDTVDAIRQALPKDVYDFQGEYSWAIERKRPFHAARLMRHSVFVLRGANQSGRK